MVITQNRLQYISVNPHIIIHNSQQMAILVFWPRHQNNKHRPISKGQKYGVFVTQQLLTWVRLTTSSTLQSLYKLL